MSAESKIGNSVKVMICQMFNGRLFRNNRGKFRTLDGNRVVSAGLSADGSSDEIGWTPITITQEMVGKTVAVFTAAEIKRDEIAYREWLSSGAKTARDQRKFIRIVNEQHGIAFCTFSEDDAKEKLRLAVDVLMHQRFND